MERIDLKRFRKDKKITQAMLATLFSCNQNFISDIEHGKKSLPVEKLEILKREFGDISGYITKSPSQIADGSSIIQQSANGTNITQQAEDKNVERFISLLEKKDEQIDRLLTIIENHSKK